MYSLYWRSPSYCRFLGSLSREHEIFPLTDKQVSAKLGGIDPEMMKALMQIKDSSVSLHDAAKRGDLQRLQEFVKDGKDVNGKDFKGVTPLGYAVGHDQLSCVKVKGHSSSSSQACKLFRSIDLDSRFAAEEHHVFSIAAVEQNVLQHVRVLSSQMEFPGASQSESAWPRTSHLLSRSASAGLCKHRDPRELQVLIDMKANLNEVDSAGNSAVHPL